MNAPDFSGILFKPLSSDEIRRLLGEIISLTKQGLLSEARDLIENTLSVLEQMRGTPSDVIPSIKTDRYATAGTYLKSARSDLEAGEHQAALVSLEVALYRQDALAWGEELA